MGVDRTAGLMFGAFAKPGSAAESALKAFCNHDNGEFMFDAIDGVCACRHGDAYSGDYAYALTSTDRPPTAGDGGHSGPIETPIGGRALIERAIAELRCDASDFEPIAFYLYLDIW
jgi:hypothetical protein